VVAKWREEDRLYSMGIMWGVERARCKIFETDFAGECGDEGERFCIFVRVLLSGCGVHFMWCCYLSKTRKKFRFQANEDCPMECFIFMGRK
jgi:hypothetical protein